MKAVIVGAGVSGLAAGMASGEPVFERSDGPGGICRSYYMRSGDGVRYDRPPPGDDAYRFEVGGGHWIFGGDPAVLALLEGLSPMTSYRRRAIVRIGDTAIPYPLQDHVDRLDPAVLRRIAAERQAPPTALPEEPTLHEWLQGSFGPTLNEIFFGPFNQRYTAGLSRVVAAQDSYKTPPLRSAPRPAEDGRTRSGYNAEFRYPAGGLDALVGAMAAQCDIRYGRQVTDIDTGDRILRFADGAEQRFEVLVSTLPLHDAIRLARIDLDEQPDPCTSVLVLNIGAEQGPRCPDAHWQYEPDSDSGFHRLGFYSNVDRSFLPEEHRRTGRRVAIYVERAYVAGFPPTPAETARYRRAAVTELQQRGYIGEVEVVAESWVETAYTWRVPGSTWRERAVSALARNGVHQVGRYGTWHFQGIAESVSDGLAIGKQLREGCLRAGDQVA